MPYKVKKIVIWSTKFTEPLMITFDHRYVWRYLAIGARLPVLWQDENNLLFERILLDINGKDKNKRKKPRVKGQKLELWNMI